MKVKRTASNVKQQPSTPGRKPSSPRKDPSSSSTPSHHHHAKIKFEPSHPILFSQNSNSCSNDTNLSAASSSTLVGGTVHGQQTLIHQKENKVRSLLKELQTLVKKCHQETLKNEPNLTSITKTHERLRKEDKITKFQRNKLRSIYSVVMKDSENEIKCLREALDCINQVRFLQNEIRILQQQMQHQPISLLSSPTSALTSNGGGGGAAGAMLSVGPAGVHDDTLKSSAVTMRRGVLMSILQQAALTLPLWVGEIGQSAPPLCGSMPPEPFYMCKIGDKVAALIKNSTNNTTITTAQQQQTSKGKNKKSAKNANQQADVSMTAATETVEEEENWILAEVVGFNQNTGRYEVDDVDAPEGQERHSLGKRRVVPLPLWRANPLTDPQAIFPKDSFVLALYPQTTCFYRGIVYEAPQSPQDDYQILFEDNTYPEGYSPPLSVPQLYIVADRAHKNK